jgi:putative peptide zinc metalloprotease protein
VSSLAGLVEASESRPLGLRMRGDLEFRPQRFGGQRYWAVKDPVALRYFQLREAEYVLLHLLDGQASFDSLRRQLNETLAPERFTTAQLHGFLGTLHRHGLVQSDAAGQGEQLAERRTHTHRREWIEALAGVLTIRLPGINPRPVLNLAYPLLSWLFTPAALLAACVLAVVALTLVAVQLKAVEARLPELDAILSASNVPWLLVTLAAVKVLHELAHGVALRRYGGECHEMGVMLLLFTPCLYCNVSDSWMLSNKWQRIVIAAAGIYIGLILASLCTLLWWFSAPGLFNSLCLNVMLICSLGTVLLNGNPLMRYDGYFILSDLVEVPNLRGQASAALRRYLSRYLLGLEPPAERGVPTRQWPLVLYAVAAGIYRIVIVALILWALDLILRPLRLQAVVVLLAGIVTGSMIVPPLAAAWHWIGNPARRPWARLRVVLACVIAGLLLAAALLVPLPRSVPAPVVLDYRDAERIYVTVGGKLASALAVGESVQPGDVIARLENPELEKELAKLRSERDQQKLFIANLQARRLQGGKAGAELPAAEAALTDLERRLEQATRDAERLTLVAGRTGSVLPPPNTPREPLQPQLLPRWTGTPLDPANVGAYLETGTLVCLVGEPGQFEAILHVDENDVELVQSGQTVRLLLEHLPGETLSGEVVEIARLDLEVMPRELAAAGALPAKTDARGQTRPLSTWYQARVRLDGNPQHLVARMHGRARISVAPQTLAARLTRWLEQTFATRAGQ